MSRDQNDQGLEGYKRLKKIAASIQDGDRVEPTTLRELLAWFGISCRTNEMVRDALIKNNLRIDPDIRAADLDGEIEFHLGSKTFDWLRARIRSDLLVTRVADWIDQNPTVTKSEIEAKAAKMEQLPISDLSSDEADDIERILKLHAGQTENGVEGEKKAGADCSESRGRQNNGANNGPSVIALVRN